MQETLKVIKLMNDKMLYRECPAGGKQQQYAWNGSRIVAINQDLLDEGYTAAGGRLCLTAHTSSCVPRHPQLAQP
jgi:hypothetical protein